MLIDTDRLVSKEKLRKNFDHYLGLAKKGGGPLAVTNDSEIVALMISPQEYEDLQGAQIADLIRSRADEATISTEEVRKRVAKAIKRGTKK
jgi:hypothetical protein